MIGTVVSRYRIVSKLGGGGMGVVYDAEDTELGRHVALKFLPEEASASGLAIERFKREAWAASALNHPHICTVHDIGMHEGRPYLVMERLEGRTLKHAIEGRPLPISKVLALGAQIADALDAAHHAGIVHRDLKPANILFRADGRPVLVDFGLARDLTVQSTLTVAGHQFIATPRYMSPEQCLGRPVDARSDLYSLGAVLYEMMTGSKIYDGANSAEVIAMHVNAPPPKLAELLEMHQPLLDRLLAKKPEDRFQSAAEVLAEIGP
jgi:serine/threonine protein kinase